MTTLAQRIKKVRSDLGLSQTALAEKAGIHQTAISKLEKRNANASRHTVEIARALGVDPYWLAKGVGSRHADHELSISEILKSYESISITDGSMAPSFKAGDVVWYERASEPEPGEYVAVKMPGKNTVTLLRRYQLTRAGRKCVPVFTPENKAYPELFADECEILGVAVVRATKINP